MSINYKRLVDGLSAAIDLVDADPGDLSAATVLITAAQEATGALGATFTQYGAIQYGAEAGRVVAACGVMDFALGQPIAAEFVDTQPDDGRPRPFVARTDSLPERFAEPLLARGVGSLTGQPVAGTASGAVHLYFADAAEATWRLAQPILRVVATAIGHLYRRAVTTPPPAPAEDDRALFLAVAGHELRTPVTVIKGYASMLADRWDSLDDRSRRDAARVLTQRSDELARLVDRILGAAAGDSAVDWLVRIIPFDPVEALMGAVSQLPSELRSGVRLDLPDRLPLASGDPAILASIITELVTNAARAGRSAAEPGIHLVAGADANTVFIRVCDRGVGIHPGHVERAFERFWYAQRDGEGERGVGLGLYLVRRLVERQDGWVSLRPREGGGTVAEVRLRRADSPHRPPAAGEA